MAGSSKNVTIKKHDENDSFINMYDQNMKSDITYNGYIWKLNCLCCKACLVFVIDAVQ